MNGAIRSGVMPFKWCRMLHVKMKVGEFEGRQLRRLGIGAAAPDSWCRGARGAIRIASCLAQDARTGTSARGFVGA